MLLALPLTSLAEGTDSDWHLDLSKGRQTLPYRMNECQHVQWQPCGTHDTVTARQTTSWNEGILDMQWRVGGT